MQSRNLTSQKFLKKSKHNPVNNRGKRGKNCAYNSSQMTVIFKRKLLLKQVVGLLLGVMKTYRQRNVWKGPSKVTQPSLPLKSRLKPTPEDTLSSEEAVLSVAVGGRDSRMSGAKPRPGLCSALSERPSFPHQKSAKESMN